MDKIIRALFMKFNAIWGNKWTSNIPDEETFNIFLEEWREGLKGISFDSMKNAINHCRNNLDWPPSISEFRQFCLRNSGFPTVDEIMHLAIRRDFMLPIVKKVYDVVGSWDFTHDDEKTLRKKISFVVTDCMTNVDVKEVAHDSHGSEDIRNNTWGNGVREAKDYLLS